MQEGQEGAVRRRRRGEGQVVLKLHGERKPGVIANARTVAEGLQDAGNILMEARNLTRNGYYDGGQDRPAGPQKGSGRFAGRDVIDSHRDLKGQILIAHWLR